MMPTPKQQSKPKPAPAPETAAPETPAVQTAGDPTRAAVLAELIKGGMSYAEAQAALGEDQGPLPAKPAPAALGKDPGADEVIDADALEAPETETEIVEINHTPAQGSLVIEELYALRKQIEQGRGRKRYRFSVELDNRLMDWLVYGTIVEATMRSRPDLTIEDFLTIKIKEMKAADPTAGGRRDPSTSGPKDLYNPATGKWG